MLDHQLGGCCSDCYHVAFCFYFPDVFSSGVYLNGNILLSNIFLLYYSEGIL